MSNQNATDLDGLAQGLPPAAQVYLDVWGMGVDPDGKALRVVTAARLAGVAPATVRTWRDRYTGFRALEQLARSKQGKSYSRRLARQIVESQVTPAGRRLAEELESREGDWRAAWEVLKAVGALAERHEITAGVSYRAEDLARDQTIAELELEEWEREHDLGELDPDAEQPPD
jgi:hypothetical protein